MSRLFLLALVVLRGALAARVRLAPDVPPAGALARFGVLTRPGGVL
jgi:hypothetical protein